MSNSDPEVELAETFGEIARALLDAADVDATLDRIGELAIQTVDGCQSVGMSAIEGRQVTSRFSTSDVPRRVDELQSETGEGPCVDAIREHEVFLTGSLSKEERWPDFAQRARDETGTESILSVRLFAAEDTMGALNLYSSEVDAFDEHDVAVASVFATHAAVALSNATREHNLEQAVGSRDVIGQAKGILMASKRLTEDEAFEVLKRASQRLHTKLRHVADEVTRTGEVPEGG